MVVFPPFRLDVADQRVWRDDKLLSLRRKPFAILAYLAANPKRLVTHEQLLESVWGGAVVSESAVRTHLHELRQVLGEGVIETVIGRGYRFTADVTTETSADQRPSAAMLPDIVGRAAELEALRAALERASTGQRQVCFVTGVPGIGKTTLVDSFLGELGQRGIVAVRGTSVEQHGAPEAYQPVIDILAQLRRSSRGEHVAAVLVRHAPTFAAHVPQLVPDGQVDEVTRRAAGSNEAKMVRELSEALEILSSQEPLVLVLEDLQWSDLATIDLLAVLAQRRERARLLVVVTARRAEVQAVTHPLNRVMRSLLARFGAISIPLDRIEAADVQRLVDVRFPGHRFPAEMIATVKRITEGVPLFVVSLLDDLCVRGMLEQRAGEWVLAASIDDVAAHRPDSITQLIDIQLDRLGTEEQRALEAAAAVGLEFSCELVAAALVTEVDHVDELCNDLARRSMFLRQDTSGYGFMHGLVQEVCLHRTAPTRLERWHRNIGQHLETTHGERAGDVAQRIAMHFDKGQAPARAVHFYTLAAERTVKRFAGPDALALYRRALELLQRLPVSPERDRSELRILQGMSSAALRDTPGIGETDPMRVFEEMVVVARRLDDPPALWSALVNLSIRLVTLARYDRAAQVLAEAEELGKSCSLVPGLLAFKDSARLVGAFWQGSLAESLALLERVLPHDIAIARFPGEDVQSGLLGFTDRKSLLVAYRSVVLWLVGKTEEAFLEAERANQFARATGDGYSVALTACNLARLRMLSGDPASVEAAAQVALGVTDAEIWHPHAQLLIHWARSQAAPMPADAVDAIQRGFHERIATFPMGTTYLGIAVLGIVRQGGFPDQALILCDEMLAFARDRGERIFEAEYARQRGELLEASDRAAAVRAYEEAIAISRAQGSVALEQLALAARARLA